MTGGSSGIGLATARAFLDEGYEVINLSRRDCPLNSPRLTSISVDLSDAAATAKGRHVGGVADAGDTVVHCAGAIREKPIEEAEVSPISRNSEICISAPHCRWFRRTCPR